MKERKNHKQSLIDLEHDINNEEESLGITFTVSHKREKIDSVDFNWHTKIALILKEKLHEGSTTFHVRDYHEAVMILKGIHHLICLSRYRRLAI